MSTISSLRGCAARLLGIVAHCAALCAALAGAAAAEPLTPIALDEVHAGMRGHGLSVFSGSTPERFEVEILGVLRNLQPEESYILARLSGRNLESTGIIAGMSGSPVFLDGRIAGAVAFSWAFGEEPIAGITPIQSMRAIPAGHPVARGAAPVAASDWRAIVSPEPASDVAGEQLARLAAVAGGDRDGLLWSVNGFGDAARARLAAALPTLSPLSGGAAVEGAGAAGLEPGGSVAAVFVDGDLRMAATGTVTDRDGDRLLAFGHGVTGLGDISMPLATAEVVAVIPSAMKSFKLANSGAVVGAFERDQPNGVAGRIGAVARTIPVEIAVGGAVERTFDLRIADLPSMLSALVGIATFGAWDVTAGFAGTRSLELDLEVGMEGRPPLRLEQSFNGEVASNRALGWLVSVLDFVDRNELAPVTVTGVRIAADLRPELRVSQVVAVRPGRTEVEPGESLDLAVDLRSFDGTTRRESRSIRIPDEVPDGRYTLYVGDGASVDGARLSVAPAQPTTLDQVFEILRSLRSSRELAVAGVLPAGGLAVSGELLPRLPGSMRSIWSAAGVRGATPVRNAVIQQESWKLERPIAGLVRIDLEVRRKREGGEAK